MSVSKTFITMQGHRLRRTAPTLGWWLIETEPGSEEFMFSHQPEAREIIEEHNRMWSEKHGQAAVKREQEAHAEFVELVRDANRRAGFTDVEIDVAWSKTPRRQMTLDL